MHCLWSGEYNTDICENATTVKLIYTKGVKVKKILQTSNTFLKEAWNKIHMHNIYFYNKKHNDLTDFS